MLGGIGLFGVMGFIVGPVIAALFLTLLEIYGKDSTNSWLWFTSGPIQKSESRVKREQPSQCPLCICGLLE